MTFNAFCRILGFYSVIFYISLLSISCKILENRSKTKEVGSVVQEETTQIRPFAEYEKTAALILSDDEKWGAKQIKTEIVKNLPPNVKLFVYIKEWHREVPVRLHYQSIRDPSLVTILDHSRFNQQKGTTFWPRDSNPYPVIKKSKESLEMGLVDVKYFKFWEPDADYAEIFNTELIKFDYTFEMGNFLADHRANCFIVKDQNSKTIPDSAFFDKFGCKKLYRMENLGGMGHIDERIKFLSDSIAVTDTPAYKDLLTKVGFDVVMLPKPDSEFATYVNSLLINGTIFVPTFGLDTDQQALDIYEQQKLKVVQIDSKLFTQARHGSIHCIAMTYPDISKITY